MRTTKHPLATRVTNLEPSGIRKVFEIANAHPEYINLSIGEPDFDMPMFLKELNLSLTIRQLRMFIKSVKQLFKTLTKTFFKHQKI